MNRKTKKIDFIFLAIIIIVALNIFIFYKINLKDGNTLIVIYDNKTIYSHPLNEDIEKIITTPLGSNKLSVKDGKAKIIEANCPDKLCVNQKSISKVGENIICLPHKLIVKIINKNTNSSDLDSISN